MEQDATNRLTGTTHGPVVQAHTIRGDVHLHVGAGEDEVPAPAVPPPSGWEDLPELPPEVQSLLEAQIQAGKDLPYQLPGARRPSLDTVYVRQDLGTGVEEPTSEQQRPTPILDSRGQLVEAPTGPVMRVTVRPPARTVTEALDDTQYLLVTGGPGQGKSTLSLRLAATIAERWFTTEPGPDPLAEPVVPLRLTARELALRLNLPFPEALANSAAAEYNRLLATPPTARILRERVAGCRWLLLIDGLDEIVGATDRDQLVTALAGWAARAGSPYRFVLTTRPIEGAALAPLQRIGADRYELQPFTDKALRHFSDHWFGDTDVGYRFVRQIRTAHLDELVRVPLLATIAAIIFETRGTRPLPDNRYELYESYLRYLRSAHDPPPSPFDGMCDELLEHLARVRVEHDTSLVTAAQDWVGPRLPNPSATWRDELTAHLRRVGLFKWRTDDLRFLHHSFAEHLAATAKARLLPEQFTAEAPEFAHLLHAARPKELGQHARAVLLHYTRLHALQANRLITWLHAAGSEQHLLAARLLAAHAPASATVVDKFLVVVRSWAMTTQHPGGDILEQTSRAVHHPGLASWLTDVMDDEKAPWESRVVAASALATRLHGPDSPSAITFLRTVIDDTDIQVCNRLSAAEALSECGAEEREHSARGLRTVLSDPNASGWDCRIAAVVLAGLGDADRDHAITVLTRMLDDPWMPSGDLADIASGLAEIGVEFHDRCADAFVTILNHTTVLAGRIRDAAVGLASLGPDRLADAVSILTSIANDRRRQHNLRLRALAALAELGPQHRVAAGDRAAQIACEFDLESYNSWNVANQLIEIGLHDHATTLLTAALDGHGLTPNNRLWVARELARLGPEHRDRAVRELRQVANDPRSSDYDRPAALAELAATGEPERSEGIAALRRILTDRSAEPRSRCNAATQMLRLGPDFHDEVIEHALEVASSRAEPRVRATAWHLLRDLDADIRRRALRELADTLTPKSAELWSSHRDALESSHYSAVDPPDHVAPGLEATLRRSTESGKARSNSISALISLGRRFHRLAYDGLLSLLRSHAMPVDTLTYVSFDASFLSSTRRAEVAAVLLEMVRQPHTTPAMTCAVASFLDRIGDRSNPEIISTLRMIVDDDSVDRNDRSDASDALAHASDDHLTAATRVALRSQGTYPDLWTRRITTLAALGAEVEPHLRKLLTSTNAQSRWRIAAAVVLSKLHLGSCSQFATELRNHCNDETLCFTFRSLALIRLLRVDPSTHSDVVEYHFCALDDERQPVADRCEAAGEAAEFDVSSTTRIMALIQRFVTDPRFTASERWAGFQVIVRLRRMWDSEENNRLGLILSRDPAIPAFVRGKLPVWMSGRARLEVERSLLVDRAASPSERVGELNTWEHYALGTQAEAVLRDILRAAESTQVERVEAAGALGNLAPLHVPEAVDLLIDQATDKRVTKLALMKLADLSLSERRRIVADAGVVVADETRSWRERRDAAVLVCELASDPSTHIVEYLRRLASDPQVADIERVRIRYLIKEMDLLRGVRDNEATAPTVRWRSATRLREFDTTDRIAGIRILDRIATEGRPALRWRAARDLTTFGERGRELGVAALEVIVSAAALPVAVRASAAGTVAYVRPDRRTEMMRSLRRLATDNPRTRLHVLQAIGRFDPLEGALALEDIAADAALTAGVRLRAATAMAALRRDFRDKAAVTAHEIAFDEACPVHIRLKAAQQLARWSDPCRAQAQSLIVRLKEASQWTRSRPADEPSSGTSAHWSAAST